MLIALIFVLGIALVVASFVIPEKMDKTLDGQVDPKAVKALMDKEMDRLRSSLDDAAEECISDNKDKLERSMDRITNEKMMAISEYSDTVLDRIHKNHEEAMFLYDMLNNKHTQVKSTAAEITEIEKNVKSIKESAAVAPATPVAAKTAEEPKKRIKPGSTLGSVFKSAPKKEDKKEEKKEPDFQPIDIPVVEVATVAEAVPVTESEPVPEVVLQETKIEETAPPVSIIAEEVDLMLTSDNDDASDKDKILELHAQGKSNMAIAKELGMGIGEVKLILDLYK